MTNITNITPVNALLIETLEALLQLAKSGDIDSAFLVFEGKKDVYTFLDGSVSAATVGEVEKLKHILLSELSNLENY